MAQEDLGQHNVTCAHRGHPIVDGKCPYHGLAHPAPPSCFVEPKKIERTDALSDLVDLTREMGEPFGAVRQAVKAPFWLWMQNTADFRHLKTVHGRGFSRLFVGEPYDVTISQDLRHSSHRIKIRPELLRRYEDMGLKPTRDHFLHFLAFPALSMTSFMGVFYSREVAYGTGKDQCVVSTTFYKRKDADIPQGVLNSAMISNRQILKEDKELCEMWAPSAIVSGNWLPGEERVAAYCKLLKEAGFEG